MSGLVRVSRVSCALEELIYVRLLVYNMIVFLGLDVNTRNSSLVKLTLLPLKFLSGLVSMLQKFSITGKESIMNVSSNQALEFISPLS